eukprot:scaffold33075_cov19-Tisochrysis_lutea.AAC.3
MGCYQWQHQTRPHQHCKNKCEEDVELEWTIDECTGQTNPNCMTRLDYIMERKEQELLCRDEGLRGEGHA